MSLLEETLITLNEAAGEIPGRPSLCTVHRWTTRGARGCILETVIVGGRRFTSPGAIRRFIEAQNSRPRNPTDRGFSNPDRREHERVERELDALGL